MKSKRKANRNPANRSSTSGDGSNKKIKLTEQSDLPPVESGGDVQHTDNDRAEDNAMEAGGTAVDSEAATESPALIKADTIDCADNPEQESLYCSTDDTNSVCSGCESVKTVAGGTHEVKGEIQVEGEEKTKSDQFPCIAAALDIFKPELTTVSSNGAAIEPCKPELTSVSSNDAAIEPYKPELTLGKQNILNQDSTDVVNKNSAFIIETCNMNTAVVVDNDRDNSVVSDTKAHDDDDLFDEEHDKKDEVPMQSEKVQDSENSSNEKECCDSTSVDVKLDNCVAEAEQPSRDTDVQSQNDQDTREGTTNTGLQRPSGLDIEEGAKNTHDQSQEDQDAGEGTTSIDILRPCGQEIGEGSSNKHAQIPHGQKLGDETTAADDKTLTDQEVGERPTDRDVQEMCYQVLQEGLAAAIEQGPGGQKDREGATSTDIKEAADQVMEAGTSGTDTEKEVDQEAGATFITDEEVGEKCADMEDAVDQETRETTTTLTDEAGETSFADAEAAVDQQAEETDMAMAIDQEAGERTNGVDIGETIDQMMGLMEEGTNGADDLTDSQLCALDWSCQVPSRSDAKPEVDRSDPSTTDTVKKLAVADNMLLENATAVVITLIKELQYLNRSLLKTKREVEAARRTRLH